MPGRESMSLWEEQDLSKSEEYVKAKRSMSAEMLIALHTEPARPKWLREDRNLPPTLVRLGSADFLLDFSEFIGGFKKKDYAVAYRLVEGWGYDEIQLVEAVSADRVSDVKHRMKGWVERYDR